MSDIEQEFTYNLPDEYLYTTDEKGLTATTTYLGPEIIWVFVEKNTGLLNPKIGYQIADEESEEFLTFLNNQAGENNIPVKVSARQEPIICDFIVNSGRDTDEMPQKEYRLENDSRVYFTRPDPTPVEDTYDFDNVRYIFSTNSWSKPFPYQTPAVSRDTWLRVLNSQIAVAKDDLSRDDLTQEQHTAVEEWKKELEEIPNKFQSWNHWFIPLPTYPLLIELEEADVIVQEEIEEDDTSEDSANN